MSKAYRRELKKKKEKKPIVLGKKEDPSVEVNKAINEQIQRGLKKGTITKTKKREPIKLKKKQGVISKGLDVISAPLSQTKETLTKGIGAGAEAVKESRERIEAGDTAEAGRVIGKTLLSTAAAAGGALVGGEIAAAAGVTTATLSETGAMVGTRVGIGRAVGTGILKGIEKGTTAITSKFSKKLLLQTAGGLAGGSGIMTWLASDNIVSSMNIFTRDLRQAVTFGQMEVDEALEKMNEGQQFVNKAKSFINTNTAINPLLWAFRGIIMTNIDAAQLVLDNNRESIIRAGKEEQETEDL